MTDTYEVPLRCSCGAIEGVATGVSPQTGTHLVCYCDDCQTFQHVIGQAEHVLDAHGGTEIFQMSAGLLRITRGADQLRCLRLGPKGPVRWYAGCCNTPIGNTMDRPALPFVGVIGAFFDRSDSDRIDRALGPLQKGVFREHALGDTSGLNAYDRFPLSSVGGFLVRVLRWRFRGDHKRTPCFDPESGALAVEPRVLSKEERAAAHAKIPVAG